MKKLAMASAVLAVLVFAGTVRAEKTTVKLALEGVHWNGCGGKIAAALGEVQSAKVTTKPTKAAPQAVVEYDSEKCELGDLAKAAAGAQTPHVAQGAPSATLVLTAASGADEKKVQEALANVKGVDAKKSALKKGEIHVKLDDKGGAKLADIQTALKGQTKG